MISQAQEQALVWGGLLILFGGLGLVATLIGLAFLIAEAAVQYVVPVVLVLAGIWILVRQFMHKEPAAPDAAALAGPEAGEPSVE
jgi:hypothetical protein